MDPNNAEYIRANRGRYTREAISAKLMRAGHSAAVPLLAWLAVTGTCYAPLWGRLSNPAA